MARRRTAPVREPVSGSRGQILQSSILMRHRKIPTGWTDDWTPSCAALALAEQVSGWPSLECLPSVDSAAALPLITLAAEAALRGVVLCSGIRVVEVHLRRRACCGTSWAISVPRHPRRRPARRSAAPLHQLCPLPECEQPMPGSDGRNKQSIARPQARRRPHGVASPGGDGGCLHHQLPAVGAGRTRAPLRGLEAAQRTHDLRPCHGLW